MIQTYNPFITVAEICTDLGVSKQRVHQIIKFYNIDHKKMGNLILVYKADYERYLKLRKQQGLYKEEDK